MRRPRSGADSIVGEVASREGHAETTEGGHAPLPVLRRRVLLTGLVLLALAVLLTALVAVPGSRSVTQRADDGWYRLMIDLRWPPFVHFSKLLSALFGTAIDWPLGALVTLLIVARRRWLALTAWALTVLVSELCIGTIKSLIDRPRPPGSLIATSGASYPSGHAIASAVTAIGIVMALTTGRRRLRWMITAATADPGRHPGTPASLAKSPGRQTTLRTEPAKPPAWAQHRWPDSAAVMDKDQLCVIRIRAKARKAWPVAGAAGGLNC